MPSKQLNDMAVFRSVNLPTLPQTLIRLLEVCNDPETDIVLVGQTVAQDVSIASKILKLANSAFLGTRSKFVDIEQAVIYLGIDTVRNLAISVSVHESFQKGTHFQNMHIGEFWYHSLLTALLAKELADLTGYDDPAEAYLAGLLHDIGKCLLNESFTEQYAKLLNIHGQSARFHQAEKDTFGITHADAGAWLAQHWNLKSSLVQAIGLHHTLSRQSASTTPLAQILFLANALADEQKANPKDIEETSASLGLSTSKLAELLVDQKSEVLEIAESLGITASAPIEDKSQLPSTSLTRGNDSGLTTKVASLAKVYGILDNLIKAQNLNRIFLVLEESLQFLFDCEKCILLLPSDRNTKLSAQGSYRNRLLRLLRGLKISLEDDNNQVLQSLHSRHLVSIDQSTTSPPDDMVKTLLDIFDETRLFALSFPISDIEKGILILASGAATNDLPQQEEILLLLSSHLGSRLQLEQLKKQHADTLARERITVMEEVASSLAHEISNPLSIIQNYISLLAANQDFPADMQKELKIIGKEIGRVDAISKQLNHLSTAPDSSTRELVDLPAVIKDTLRLFRSTAGADKNVDISLELEPGLPPTWTISDALQQILNNLLSNSLDAVSTGGKIEIKCFYQASGETGKDDEIVITVADNGPGISPAIAANLFRAGQTTKGKGHAGLGLAIVKKLTADLAGRIYHSTGSEGQTLFALHLPVKKSPPP